MMQLWQWRGVRRNCWWWLLQHLPVGVSTRHKHKDREQAGAGCRVRVRRIAPRAWRRAGRRNSAVNARIWIEIKMV